MQCCKPPEPQGGTRGILSYSACRYSCSCQAKPSQAKPSQARPGQAVARLCTVGPQCQHTAGLPTYLPGWLSSTETTCGRNPKTVHRVSLTAQRTAPTGLFNGPQARSLSTIAAIMHALGQERTVAHLCRAADDGVVQSRHAVGLSNHRMAPIRHGGYTVH